MGRLWRRRDPAVHADYRASGLSVDQLSALACLLVADSRDPSIWGTATDLDEPTRARRPILDDLRAVDRELDDIVLGADLAQRDGRWGLAHGDLFVELEAGRTGWGSALIEAGKLRARQPAITTYDREPTSAMQGYMMGDMVN